MNTFALINHKCVYLGQYKTNRLKTIAITVITVLIAAGFAVTLISWRRQKHNVKFLYRQIEENRQKARLAEEQMLQASHTPPALHEAEDNVNEDNKTDMDLLTTLHDSRKKDVSSTAGSPWNRLPGNSP